MTGYGFGFLAWMVGGVVALFFLALKIIAVLIVVAICILLFAGSGANSY